MRALRFIPFLVLILCPASIAAPRVSYHSDATYLANLYWTISNLTDTNSDHRRFWEQRFGLSDEDKEALQILGALLGRLRGRYRVWESNDVMTPLVTGPMVGLFIAPMSSFEQRVLVAMATTNDLGTVRGKMPDLSFDEVNAIAGTCARFLGKFDTLWESIGPSQSQHASRMNELMKKRKSEIDDFVSQASSFYGVDRISHDILRNDKNPQVQFEVHFLWSPRETGGQCMLVENHLFCETSEREDPQRYLLGLLHETCHYLSALVPTPIKYRRTDAMLKDGIYYPLTLLEESLATTLAQGIGSKRLAPGLFNLDSQWVSHLDGQVDAVAKALLPIVEPVYESSGTIDLAQIERIAVRCREIINPNPKDYTTVSLITGNKELRDYLRKGISRGTGLRYGLDYTDVQSLERIASQLPAWFNRVFIVSGATDLNPDMRRLPPSPWLLPIDRDEFDTLRGQHNQFIFTRRYTSRYEFVLYANDDRNLRRVIDEFKQSTAVQEGLMIIEKK